MTAMKPNWVGPVLQPGGLTDAVISALRDLNTDLQVTDRGSYLRILAENECRLTKSSVEEITGRPFHLPSDLEAIMSSFKGKLSISDSEVRWTAFKKGSDQ